LRVLIYGGGGQIARAVRAAAAVQHEIAVETHTQVDIGNAKQVTRSLQEFRPDWVVNGAAYTSVDLAEDQPAQAQAVNDTAVAVIANATAMAGCRLLQLSTDFVFDGESNRAYLPSDAANPLSVYGTTKLAGERHALRASKSNIVLRTSWIYAADGRNFVLTMLRLMREKNELRIVSDQIGVPTSARSVAAVIWGLIEADSVGGIYHWADLGVASWYDLAVAVQEEARIRGLLTDDIPIVPIKSVEYPTRAKRPAFSVLDSTITRSVLKTSGVHWRQNLRATLDELRPA
jgi:dTDP-4-dehydrorhamnose reductase